MQKFAFWRTKSNLKKRVFGCKKCLLSMFPWGRESGEKEKKERKKGREGGREVRGGERKRRSTKNNAKDNRKKDGQEPTRR